MGYSLAPNDERSLFDQVDLKEKCISHIDISLIKII